LGRLLAVFNVIAGGASIIGLYITAYTDYKSWVIGLIFAITIIFVAYVLFVPSNRIEANVSAKLQRFQSPNGIGTVTKVQDEFLVRGNERKEIPFPHPFKEVPQVELIKLSRDEWVAHSVSNITVHKFVVIANSSLFSSREVRYRWIATGTLLPRM
jgi:hypothetical protein